MRNNSPEQDFAIMSSCNDSIIDYGTYAVWGAMLSGVDTFVYTLTNSGAFVLALLFPDWYIVA